MIPGEYKLKEDFIECNAGKDAITIEVVNRGDRPIQIGSHFHFYEVNSFLSFNREKAYGRRLNIPSGTAVRFEPGDSKEVELIPFSGKKEVYGLNNFTNGSLDRGEED